MSGATEDPASSYPEATDAVDHQLLVVHLHRAMGQCQQQPDAWLNGPLPLIPLREEGSQEITSVLEVQTFPGITFHQRYNGTIHTVAAHQPRQT